MHSATQAFTRESQEAHLFIQLSRQVRHLGLCPVQLVMQPLLLPRSLALPLLLLPAVIYISYIYGKYLSISLSIYLV